MGNKVCCGSGTAEKNTTEKPNARTTKRKSKKGKGVNESSESAVNNRSTLETYRITEKGNT